MAGRECTPPYGNRSLLLLDERSDGEFVHGLLRGCGYHVVHLIQHSEPEHRQHSGGRHHILAVACCLGDVDVDGAACVRTSRSSVPRSESSVALCHSIAPVRWFSSSLLSVSAAACDESRVIPMIRYPSRVIVACTSSPRSLAKSMYIWDAALQVASCEKNVLMI